MSGPCWPTGGRSGACPATRSRRSPSPGTRSGSPTSGSAAPRPPGVPDPTAHLPPVPPRLDKPRSTTAMSNPTVADLVARSNRLGADPRNTNYAGGNTSAKGTEIDPVTGQDVELVWVKGAGGDLGTL